MGGCKPGGGFRYVHEILKVVLTVVSDVSEQVASRSQKGFEKDLSVYDQDIGLAKLSRSM